MRYVPRPMPYLFATRLKRAKKKWAQKQKRKQNSLLKSKKQDTPKESSVLNSREWKVLRYRALRTYGRICMLCHSTSGPMHVDHIKPRSKYPELTFDFNNLQILCESCNQGKSDKYEDDFRPKPNIPI